jgi:hypothetical protein
MTSARLTSRDSAANYQRRFGPGAMWSTSRETA